MFWLLETKLQNELLRRGYLCKTVVTTQNGIKMPQDAMQRGLGQTINIVSHVTFMSMLKFI